MQSKTIQQWEAGKNRCWGMMVCCEKCGTTYTKVNETLSERVHRRVCTSCGHSWKEVTDTAASKATVVAVY
jgi:transposase-like protein